ncbi:MAG: bifunctional riboflavin kinase/FAD synthetase [Elstera sp.]
MTRTPAQGTCLLRDLTCLPERLRGGAVAVGNFDGVHLGHRAVIDAARAVAEAQGLPLLALTFEPHPRSLFARLNGKSAPDPFRLTPGMTKIKALAELGLDAILCLRFTPLFAQQTPDDFIQQVLIDGLGVRHVAIGHDFCFGRGRAGNAGTLSAAGPFTVSALPPQRRANADGTGEAFASTLIRDHLRAGRVEEAAALLGRPFAITGRVRHGDKRGRTIGFPTANIELGDYLRPAFGVYAVTVEAEGQSYQGVANLGRRPTVAGLVERLEVHLFDFAGDLYGRKLTVALRHFLRPEQKFDGLDALTRQINLDADAARDKLAALC